MNKVILIGNLGGIPSCEYTPSGIAVSNFSVATKERVKNSATQKWEDRTEWHKVVVFGQKAEFLGKYAHKGDTISIEGKIQTQTYEKDGETKYFTKVIADHVTVITSKQRGSAVYTKEPEVHESPASSVGLFDSQTSTTVTPQMDYDDIPF